MKRSAKSCTSYPLALGLLWPPSTSKYSNHFFSIRSSLPKSVVSHPKYLPHLLQSLYFLPMPLISLQPTWVLLSSGLPHAHSCHIPLHSFLFSTIRGGGGAEAKTFIQYIASSRRRLDAQQLCGGAGRAIRSHLALVSGCFARATATKGAAARIETVGKVGHAVNGRGCRQRFVAAGVIIHYGRKDREGFCLAVAVQHKRINTLIYTQHFMADSQRGR